MKITPSKNTNNPENDYKYFDYLDNLTNNIHLVDLHVIRGEESICVKQNLNFILQENDMVEMGTLIC